MAGRLLLRWAALLQKRVASKAAWDRMQERRNRAVRGAERRGVSVEKLAARLDLTPGWVRQVLKDDQPPEVPTLEEAA
ncbi:hypothetical protein [Streptomyces sp. UH6]|uniref:hypothetical protein n=1 Tax=Streptomyces sp. UH6 TaxID=2748379 RepID=UPI001C5501DE|nr:hypothetical protein [Streptomyces sp. UH6]